MRGRRINPFIRAHGAIAGPYMRPRLIGVIAGLIAAIATLLVFLPAGLFNSFAVGSNVTIPLYFAYSVASGFIYGSIYRRAANDRKGGWIFGASTGFILWILNPAIWFPWLGLKPVLIGRAGLLVLLLHIVHGAITGFVYPWVHVAETRCDNPSRFIE